ncbi:MAG: Rid family detoxifying hydrolase [Parasphingopyxis sp.]|nr:Rid family detoxifying hydrolase [Sphingomonadales bacterium]
MIRHFHPAIAAILLGCAGPGATAGIEHYQGSLAELELPFSEAVIVGDLVFLSGQIGNRPGTLELAEGGIEGETRQMMANIGATLDALGLDFSNIVKCTVMLDEMAEWGAFNAIYREYFTAPYPARSALGADGLALGARVEMECIAAR